MRTLGLWGFLLGCLLLGNYLEGGNLRRLFQPTAAVMVFLPIIGFFTFTLGVQGFWSFLQRLFRQQLNGNDIEIMQKATSLGFLLGFVGATFGMIHVMSHLDQAATIGRGLAVAFTSIWYGALPGILFSPMRSRLGKPTLQIVSSDTKKSGGYTAASLAFLLFGYFTAMYALTQAA